VGDASRRAGSASLEGSAPASCTASALRNDGGTPTETWLSAPGAVPRGAAGASLASTAESIKHAADAAQPFALRRARVNGLQPLELGAACPAPCLRIRRSRDDGVSRGGTFTAQKTRHSLGFVGKGARAPLPLGSRRASRRFPAPTLEPPRPAARLSRARRPRLARYSRIGAADLGSRAWISTARRAA
jgi:hypothetical protein